MFDKEFNFNDLTEKTEIGRGGQSIVYEARSKLDNKIFAIKLYETDRKEYYIDIQNELMILVSVKNSKTKHKNIIPIKGIYQWKEKT